MSCYCIQDKKYIFTIDYFEKYLVYNDFSEWLIPTRENTTNSNNTTTQTLLSNKLEAFTLKISSLDNQDLFKEYQVFPNSSVIINYSELPSFGSDSCKWDGIFKFSINPCQGTQFLEQQVAILKNLMGSYYLLRRESNHEAANQLLEYIESIKAFAQIQDSENMVKFYKLAMKLVNKLKCNCDELHMFKCTNIHT